MYIDIYSCAKSKNSTNNCLILRRTNSACIHTYVYTNAVPWKNNIFQNAEFFQKISYVKFPKNLKFAPISYIIDVGQNNKLSFKVKIKKKNPKWKYLLKQTSNIRLHSD